MCLFLPVQGSGPCQFPGDIQGAWATQTLRGHDLPFEGGGEEQLRTGGVKYSMVTVEHDRITGWGSCVARHGGRYVLAEK